MQEYILFHNALEQPHLLIAGATGSGKSVAEKGLLYTLTGRPSGDRVNGFQYILIDCKRVELWPFRVCPHCVSYIDEPEQAVQELKRVLSVIGRRYTIARRYGVTKYPFGDLYIFIDEFADLMTTAKKQVQPLIQRIAQIGRAARVHLVICTQTPIAKVLPTEIKCNFDARLALRTRSKQDSRNIIEQTGCESLQVGTGVYYDAAGLQLVKVPYITDADIMQRCRQRKKSLFPLFRMRQKEAQY